MKGRGGFSLIELLVALVLLSFAMLLLFRGVEAVSETLRQGRRQSQMQRSLHQALRLLQEDLEQLVVKGVDLPTLRIDLRNPDEGSLTFARLRQEAAPESDLEFVEYRVRPHPDIPGLHQLLRAAGPLLFWLPASHVPGEEEILVDELVGIQIHLTRGDTEAQAVEFAAEGIPPAHIDILLGVTAPPFSPVARPDESFLLRLQQFDGIHGQIRITPRMRVRP